MEGWPTEVVHDTLRRSRYTAAWTPTQPREEDENEEAEVRNESQEPKKPTPKEEEVAKPWYRRFI